MKNLIRAFAILCIALPALASCGHDDEPKDIPYVPDRPYDTSIYRDDPLWQRHHASAHKILAIGNSFTINACTHLPWLFDTLNNDSICIARLTRSGCSLDMHWQSHVEDTPDYDFYFSDSGSWRLSDIRTIDDALHVLDWDVIVIQQASGWSGLYRTYQPYLDNLVKLFRETNTEAMLAWHYTWAYTEWTKHTEFGNYDKDPEKMYNAIIDAGDRASGNFELRIPSATLIKRMREAYLEVENGFSEDGYHIVDDIALYALSTLWYEVLAGPYTGTSSLGVTEFPAGIDAEHLQKGLDIIKDLMASPGSL